MSALVCSISGFPLIQGVISKKTGHLYQKSTIQTHIRTFKTCPHTQQPLQQSDLLQIKSGNNQFSTQSRSVTELIQKLSKQYDSLILQSQINKQDLQKTREQLAVSLYHQDASLRVIAKLKSQLEGKKQQISSVLEQIAIQQNKKSKN